MSKENKRDIRDVEGKPLRDFPEEEIIFRPKAVPGVGMVSEAVRIPGREMPVITGVRAPDAQPEEEVKAVPTRAGTTNRAAVADSRHVMSHILGVPKTETGEIEGGRMPEHLTPTRTQAKVVQISPADKRSMKRTMTFIDSLQPEEADE